MPDECCDDRRQPIENIFCFHRRLRRQQKDIRIEWEEKSVSYNEKVQTFQETAELKTEGRQAVISYKQELTFIQASIDLYEIEEDDIHRLACIQDYILSLNVDQGNYIHYAVQDKIIIAVGNIYTNKDCEAYIDDFIQIREDLKFVANNFIDILRDIQDKCPDDIDTRNKDQPDS